LTITTNSIIAVLLSCLCCLHAQLRAQEVFSPDKKIKLDFIVRNGGAHFKVWYNNKQLLEESPLGIVMMDEHFESDLRLVSTSKVMTVANSYGMKNAKKSSITYQASKRIFHLQNGHAKKMDIIFQLSNDGLAFRYFFPERTPEIKKITREVTAYKFSTDAKAWLQPMSVAKSGWQQSNPSYEEGYRQDIPVGTPSAAGWVYPALFKTNDTWLLITESSLDSSFCGTKLINDSAGSLYHVGFPDPREIFTGRGLLPQSPLPWYSPWRIITIGSLKTIVESTLGSDLASPALKIDPSFVKPGKASWSWINSKDDSIVYSEQKRYIDFAADMHWQYCLIDVNWDTKIGYEKIKELADYGATKNVGLILWYNSAGDWNTTPYHPKSFLLTQEQREKEFGRLQQMGIKGVKIDFFGGDGQSMIKYYHDILIDAARFKLLVNFHGATLPRGWDRTYPHLMSTEAIRGFEMVTFNQQDADAEATHCAMLPFTRNAFDPMDFTPVNLYKINTRVQRKTTSAFELALSVLFLSGIQHYAESPAGMQQVPPYVKDFLRQLPDYWDDVRFIEGYPGRQVVIARRSGSRWYVCGINGEKTEKNLILDLSYLKIRKGTMIADGTGPLSFQTKEINLSPTGQVNVSMKGSGGFVIIFQ
jgi:hypothetical protein